MEGVVVGVVVVDGGGREHGVEGGASERKHGRQPDGGRSEK